MLIVETVARIRREFFVKGKSIKEIVRDLPRRDAHGWPIGECRVWSGDAGITAVHMASATGPSRRWHRL